MLEHIIIAGAGGQGVILLGKLIARAALAKIPYITFFPAYGAEVRGGASYCEVIFADQEIASPCAERAENLILMNQLGAEEVLSKLTPNGLVLTNSCLCKITPLPGQTLAEIPASLLADQAGNPRVANLIMLGALLRRKPLFAYSDLEKVICENFAGPKHADMLKVNLQALRMGMEHV